MRDRLNILVIYYHRWTYPLRNSIYSHLYSLKRYSRHNIIYVNAAFGIPWRVLGLVKLDAVVFHTIFLSTRWTPPVFYENLRRCAPLKELDCVKIALPQDEFIHTGALNDFIEDFGIDWVLSCADSSQWPKIYDRVDQTKVNFRTVLTGYIDEDQVEKIALLKESRCEGRGIDIGYRAWKAPYWLGRHGQLKTRVAEIFSDEAPRKGLAVDISTEEEDTLFGDDWFRFLLDCNFTIGVEGGASLLDTDGAVKELVETYLSENPAAPFEEVEEKCFSGLDGGLSLMCISPRHFEACMTGTGQILVEGGYSGVLEPWKHYLPLKDDFSNLEEVFEAMKDRENMASIARSAYEDVVESGRWSYRSFTEEIEALILSGARARPGGRGIIDSAVSALIGVRERCNWLVIIIGAGVLKFLNGLFPGENWRALVPVEVRLKGPYRQVFSIGLAVVKRIFQKYIMRRGRES